MPTINTTANVCKICDAVLTGHQRSYCTACVTKYPQNHIRQIMMQPPEEREAFAQRQKQLRHEKYTQKLAAMSPEELAEYRAQRSKYALAHRAKRIAAMSSEELAEYRRMESKHSSAYYAKKIETMTPDELEKWRAHSRAASRARYNRITSSSPDKSKLLKQQHSEHEATKSKK